ncbi:hypothetical protein [Mycolicibacterium phlei]
MLSAIAIVPSAPVMVPQLAGGAAAELAALHEAVFAAVAELPDRWIAVGVGDTCTVIGPRTAGTFAGYGVDVRVTLSPGVDDEPVPLPLCALITGWVRGAARPGAVAEVRVFADGCADSVARGRQLRAELDAVAEPVGVLIVGDGANTLTPPAPGGYDPGSLPLQQAFDEALAGGDAAALTRLPAAITARTAFEVLAGLAEPGPRAAKELYRGAPYGVGYFAGVWKP